MKRKLLLFAIAIMAVATLVGCGKTFNPNKYVSVEITGYNGYGEVDVNWDEKALAEDFKKLEYIEDASTMKLFYGSPINYITGYCLDYEIDAPENLKNGDKVTLVWECDEADIIEYTNAKVKYPDLSITVKGLEEAETFDAFAAVNVEFSGLSPVGTVRVENIAQANNPASKLSYTVDKTSGLKNGDVVTVSVKYADNSEYMIELMGGVPASATKEYTVSGLDAYATKLADINEEMYNKMQQQARDTLTSHIADYYDDPSEVKNVELVGNYFHVPKNPNASGVVQNRIDYIYKITAYCESTEETFDYYWYCGYRNIVVLADGAVSVELNATVTPTSYSSWGAIEGEVFRYPDKGLYYVGYRTLDDLFYNRITRNVADYNYESTVK